MKYCIKNIAQVKSYNGYYYYFIYIYIYIYPLITYMQQQIKPHKLEWVLFHGCIPRNIFFKSIYKTLKYIKMILKNCIQ